MFKEMNLGEMPVLTQLLMFTANTIDAVLVTCCCSFRRCSWSGVNYAGKTETGR